MPPREFSRYSLTSAITLSDDTQILTERTRFLFEQFPDNRTITVEGGESLFTIADKFLSPLPRAAGLWWVIADFQTPPIHDPTIKLERGQVLVIPSVQTVINRIFDDTRRNENF